MATATVDRLLHHAHLCQTSGDSVRLAQALQVKSRDVVYRGRRVILRLRGSGG
jgi:DNA replication protein DnaC